jgi:tetratricopeptide (TPR) repeat protein
MRTPFKKQHLSKGNQRLVSSQRVQALLKCAVEMHQRGELDEALGHYTAVLSAEPKNFEALHLSGLIAYQKANPGHGAMLMREALKINPLSVACMVNLGLAEHALGNFELAIEKYRTALSIQPFLASAFYNRANVYKEQCRWDLAEGDYQIAIVINPGYWEAYLNLGVVQEHRANWGGSLDSLKKVIVINPRCVKAYNNRGNVYKKTEQWMQALNDYDMCLKFDQRYVDAYINKGNLLKELGYYDQASLLYSQALSLEPKNSKVLWNKSLLSLLQEDFNEGWKNYETRWSRENTAQLNPYLSNLPEITAHLQWRGGQTLSGKKLLIYAEQGLGDSIQFVRFVPLLAQLGATVYLAVQLSLFELFKCIHGVDRLCVLGQALPEFDLACPLMSLPLALGLTSTEQFGSEPYLAAQDLRVLNWMEILPSQRPRVGVVWRGSQYHANDKYRSLTWSKFKDCLSPVTNYVSLQKDINQEESIFLQQEVGVLDVANQLKDFSDTAALCKTLDLVICVDTSVAHLAAALGVEVWLLIPYSPDWRWTAQGDRSKWYKNLKLYRQSQWGQWDAPLNKVRLDLEAKFKDT